MQMVDQKAFMDGLRCMYYLKVVGSNSITPSVNTMQQCNEYNYAHYEFLLLCLVYVPDRLHSVLQILNPCFSQIWHAQRDMAEVTSLRIFFNHSWLFDKLKTKAYLE